MRHSEIRDSQISDLLEKVRKRNYGSYLRSIFLKRIRHFAGATINFDFPVTALVGPNGSGKSTVLACAACAYDTANPRDFFFTSIVGDDQNFSWEIEYELIERNLSAQDALRGRVQITKDVVELSPKAARPQKYFGVNRTLPPITNPHYMRRYLRGASKATFLGYTDVDMELIRCEASKVLGKELSSFKLLNLSFTRDMRVRKRIKIDGEGQRYKRVVEVGPVTSHQQLFVAEGDEKYSEFNFGAGEASVLRLIYGIEGLPEQALVLIEEIENGLHPLAVERLVEYLIAAAIRRKVQIIFTTHSEYALSPLPSEAVWSTLNGRLIQGSLSVESLRALSGRIDKKLAIFTEDYFASKWMEAILREGLGKRFDEVGIYHLKGDGEAIRIHLAHNENPSVKFESMCFIDGDSQQQEDQAKGVFRLPGQNPELFVFNAVCRDIQKNAAVLTAACQRPLSCQKEVVEAVKDVAISNRDPHLLFAQVGSRIGLVSEEIVRGAFFSVWIQDDLENVSRVSQHVSQCLDTIRES